MLTRILRLLSQPRIKRVDNRSSGFPYGDDIAASGGDLPHLPRALVANRHGNVAGEHGSSVIERSLRNHG